MSRRIIFGFRGTPGRVYAHYPTSPVCYAAPVEENATLTVAAFQSRVLLMLHEINSKLDVIMTAQDDINATAQQIEADVAAQNAATAAIKTALANLEAQVAAGQAPDLTPLKAAVSDLDSATAAEQSAVPPATA